VKLAFYALFLTSTDRNVANSPGARKRARQAVTRRAHNMGMRAMMRTCVKNVYYAIEKGDKPAAEAAYKEAVPAIDRMADKGMIHRNKAARHKSRLNHHIHNM
jgi:small subunit ribosomal protein S20